MATDDQTSQNDQQGSEPTSLLDVSRQMYPNDAPPQDSDQAGGDHGGSTETGEEEAAEEEETGEEAGDESEEDDDGDEETDEEGGEPGERGGESEPEVDALDEETVMGQEVTIKVNGRESKVPVKDMAASYQTLEAAREELDSAKEITQNERQKWQDRVQWADEQYNTAATLIQEAENLLKQDFEQVDWQKLREQDPAEWSAKKADYDERQRKLDEMKNRAAQSYQQASQDQQQRLQQDQQERLQEEQQKLLERLPEWKDEEKAQAGKTKLVKYLQNEGLSESELSNVTDHRLLVMAEKARRYDEINSKSKPSKKRVRNKTRTVKPGTSQPQDKGQGDTSDPVNILYGS